MRVAYLIGGVWFVLLGVFNLYRGFQYHGDFMPYLIGGLQTVLGIVFFVLSSRSPKSRQEV
jgi:hypothetical protein